MTELDTKGLKCPMPIVKLGTAVRQLPVGESIRIIADDKGFSPDVRAWCSKTGHELVSLDEKNPTAIVAIVRRAH